MADIGQVDARSAPLRIKKGKLMTPAIVAFALLWIWPFSSGTEYHLSGTRIVPAATATLKANRDKQNGNTKLDLKVEHLARPSSLTPPASVYIVWVEPRGSEPHKEGALGVGDDLKGELKMVTIEKEFDLVVTAENSESASFPSNMQVFHTHVTLH